jgi:hypothetical protein
METLRGNIASFWSAPTSALSFDSGEAALPDDIQKLYSNLLKLSPNSTDRTLGLCPKPRRGTSSPDPFL